MSEQIRVELPLPGSAPLGVEWDAIELAELRPGLTPDRSLWRLNGELDWESVDALRVLSGRLGDGRVLAVAALRPAGTAGHAEDSSAGVIGSGSELEPLREILLSTEYGADGRPRRIGLELLAGASELPLRVAGDVRAPSDPSEEGGTARERAFLELRAGEASGTGVLEVLRRA